MTKYTKEDLIAMPESEYMNEDQLAYFLELLQTTRDELLKEIAEAKENLTVKEDMPDPLDLAAHQEMFQLNLRTTERKTRLLHKVETAIQRIHDGSYGYCSKTGEPIGVPRLLARPTATLCIDSKEQQEHHEKTEGQWDEESN